MKNSKIISIANLLAALGKDKAKEIESRLDAGNISRSEINRLLIFKDIFFTKDEVGELVSDNYHSIEARMGILFLNGFDVEAVMIGILFLKDEINDRALYDNELNVSDPSFGGVLYQLCASLHRSKQWVLCNEYMRLLKKLINQGEFYILPEDKLNLIERDCMYNS